VTSRDNAPLQLQSVLPGPGAATTVFWTMPAMREHVQGE